MRAVLSTRRPDRANGYSTFQIGKVGVQELRWDGVDCIIDI
jgi:hypothetical protein